MRNFFQYNAYFFDLDDTLYPETSYLFAAYREIARFTAEKYNRDEIEIYTFLKYRFLECGRKNIFDKMNKHFATEEAGIHDYLNILRTINPGHKLPLYEKTKVLLKKLNRTNKKIFIVSNGNIRQQKNKIKHLDWENIKVAEVIYAGMSQPKPSPESVIAIIKKYGFSPAECLFIGDSYVDELTAKNAEMDFLNIRYLPQNI